MAAQYELNIDQGANFLITLTIKDETGATMDLTGFTFRGKIKTSFSDSVAVANFSFKILDQVTSRGLVEVSLTDTETAALVAPAQGTVRTLTKMVYDIESEDGSGFVRRWLEGDVLVSPEVTK
jgi:hypothetical protein